MSRRLQEFSNYNNTTIAAQLTPRVPAAIAIIRISGDKARSFLLFHSNLTLQKLKPRYAHYINFFIPNVSTPMAVHSLRGGQAMDACLAIYFKSPHSFTGEDVVELYLHGSQVIVDAAMQAALAFGIVLAERGEFSRRAFLNGKISALQAEATNALVHASTQRATKNALRALEGRSGLQFSHFSTMVHSMLANLEVAIEYPEEDLPQHDHNKTEVYATYKQKLADMQSYLKQLVHNTRRGKVLEAGESVVLLGAVNAGKSTLMNLLLGEDRSIVSEQAGATRDTLREGLMLEGGRVFITDTAGLRAALPNSVEASGMQRAISSAKAADCVLCVVASLDDFNLIKNHLQTLQKEIGDDERLLGDHWFFILNKTDLLGAEARVVRAEMEKFVSSLTVNSAAINAAGEEKLGRTFASRIITTSFTTKKDDSRQVVLNLLEDFLFSTAEFNEEDPLLFSIRQLKVCEQLLTHLNAIQGLLQQFAGEEEVLEDLRYLSSLLSELDISVDDDSVLSAIFSEFCIGK